MYGKGNSCAPDCGRSCGAAKGYDDVVGPEEGHGECGEFVFHLRFFRGFMAVVTAEMTRTVWAWIGVTPGARVAPMTWAACWMRRLGTVVVVVTGGAAVVVGTVSGGTVSGTVVEVVEVVLVVEVVVVELVVVVVVVGAAVVVVEGSVVVVGASVVVDGSGSVVDGSGGLVVVVGGSVVVVEVVVVVTGPYDQTYWGPGSPLRHASQSAQVGHLSAAASSAGWIMSQRSAPEMQVKCLPSVA